VLCAGTICQLDRNLTPSDCIGALKVSQDKNSEEIIRDWILALFSSTFWNWC